jgi:hypothetical protein
MHKYDTPNYLIAQFGAIQRLFLQEAEIVEIVHTADHYKGVWIPS